VKSVGFEFVGIAKAEKLDNEARLLEKWLQNNYNGKMGYMEKWFDKRIDPRLLVPGAKSVICMLFNYMPKENLQEDSYKIAKYAYGNDYHEVLKSKLATVLTNLRLKIGEFDARIFVDSAPVMERTWAKRSGLGWQGKHTLLIHKKRGSYFFIATIICDLDLEYDSPFTSDHCGSCTRCIDACPTEAIVGNNILDASKCISYLTIELKDEIPQEFRGKMDDWIFGCDICQNVCPWNSFAFAHSEDAFDPNSALLSMQKKDWDELSQDLFKTLFKHTPLQRTKWKGLRRNIDFIRS
jgi:epoxyqueuosine reductase